MFNRKIELIIRTGMYVRTEYIPKKAPYRTAVNFGAPVLARTGMHGGFAWADERRLSES